MAIPKITYAEKHKIDTAVIDASDEACAWLKDKKPHLAFKITVTGTGAYEF